MEVNLCRKRKDDFSVYSYPTDMQDSKETIYPIYYRLQVQMPMMTYDPFWRMMNERRISTYSLEVDYGFNKSIIHRLKNNKNMNLSYIDYICNVFCCPVEDVVVHIRNDCAANEDGTESGGK